MNLCVITLVAGLLLGVVYQVTKGPIKQAEIAAQAEAFKAVCPDADSFDEAPDLFAKAADVEGKYGSVVVDSAYKALDASGAECGCVVNVTTKEGFGGEIQVSVGFDAEGVVTGIEFLSINETAGLGMNATEESWRAQYAGKAVDEYEVVKGGASADNQIDAISGATITSKAVTGAVNTALALVKAAQ
ncbi:MAG: RnfABCDGE type electron transport complex subunit G [Eubacteriales bacterium]|nr:RnfABCDGE type electron transport complex subunit G [Eubacteriales bacterium]